MPGVVVKVLDSRLGAKLHGGGAAHLVATKTMTRKDVVSAMLARLGTGSPAQLDILAHGYYTQHDAKMKTSNVGGKGAMLGTVDLIFTTAGASPRSSRASTGAAASTCSPARPQTPIPPPDRRRRARG